MMFKRRFDFQNVDKRECVQQTLELQFNIASAWMKKDQPLVKQLTHKLHRSFAARVWAVEKSKLSMGRDTPGIDGVTFGAMSGDDINSLVHEMSDLSRYVASPVRRINIPKGSKPVLKMGALGETTLQWEKRPLGIPTIKDRCVQNLISLGLYPIAECNADLHSYGFRTGRGVQDAREYILKGIKPRDRRCVFEGDISKFFDEVSHSWLLENIPVDQDLLGEVLSAGFMFEGSFNPTLKGFPQGGPLSPMLANMTLDGMESLCMKRSFHFLRYADDFLIFGGENRLQELNGVMRDEISNFLSIRGLTQHPTKSKASGVVSGFDFTGFHYMEIAGKVFGDKASSVTKVSNRYLVATIPKQAKTAFWAKIRKVVRLDDKQKASTLIATLNPILRGWSEYYRYCSLSGSVFSATGQYIWKVLWSAVRHKHPKMTKSKLVSLYFRKGGGQYGTSNWVFFDSQMEDKDGKGSHSLLQIGEVRMKKKVRCDERYHRFNQKI
jgi:RNA-directed DNA polymerase